MVRKRETTEQLDLISGWKNIANHLGMGVRTVQRYERKMGLPVRRLSGKATGAVVAAKSDLDSWVKSSATEQESFNRKQKSLNAEQDEINAAQKSLNAEQDSINLAQTSFNKETRSAEDRVVSEIARGLRDVAALQTEMAELRKELRMVVRNIRESLLKSRRQIDATRRRQNVIASPKDRSRVRLRGKRQKAN